MPWNALILPLIGGYFLLTRCLYFKHDSRRTERQRLIFDSALTGSILLIISFFICIGLKFLARNYFSSIQIHSLDIPFFYTSLGAYLLGILPTLLFNLFTKEGKEKQFLKKAILKHGSSLHTLLIRCVEDEELLMASLKNGKVYVGRVIEMHEPHSKSFIEFIPLLSGYRSDPNQRVIFTTDYSKVFNTQLNEGESLEDSKIRTVISESDILSATIFDHEYYSEFQYHSKNLVSKKFSQFRKLLFKCINIDLRPIHW